MSKLTLMIVLIGAAIATLAWRDAQAKQRTETSQPTSASSQTPSIDSKMSVHSPFTGDSKMAVRSPFNGDPGIVKNQAPTTDTTQANADQPAPQRVDLQGIHVVSKPDQGTDGSQR